MKPSWIEIVTVLIGSALNMFLWFALLSALTAAIVSSITGFVFAMLVSVLFNLLDKRRATMSNKSDK